MLLLLFRVIVFINYSNLFCRWSSYIEFCEWLYKFCYEWSLSWLLWFWLWLVISYYGLLFSVYYQWCMIIIDINIYFGPLLYLIKPYLLQHLLNMHVLQLRRYRTIYSNGLMMRTIIRLVQYLLLRTTFHQRLHPKVSCDVEYVVNTL